MTLDFSALSSVMDNEVQTEPTGIQVLELDISKVKPDPNQPRKFFDEDKLDELGDNMNTYGQLQPITVNEPDMFGNYIIHMGERRYRAALKKGWPTIKAILGEFNKYARMSENIQREGFNLEELAAFIKECKEEGDKLTQIAKNLHLQKSVISKYDAFNERPECVDTAYKNGLVEGVKNVYELIGLYKKYPSETEKWLSERIKPITSSDISFQLDFFSGKVSPASKSNTPLPMGYSEENETSEVTDSISKNDDSKTESSDADEQHYAEKNTKSKEPKIIDETKLSKSLILCLVDERECTLEYKQKPTQVGFVWVKFEDGETVEIVAESVKINSIIEG